METSLQLLAIKSDVFMQAAGRIKSDGCPTDRMRDNIVYSESSPGIHRVESPNNGILLHALVVFERESLKVVDPLRSTELRNIECSSK